MFNSKTTEASNYSICSNLNVQKQNRQASSPFQEKRMYLNEKQSLSWDKLIQSEYCPCIYCPYKFVMLYQNELTEKKTDEENYLNTWYLKENLTHQQLLKLKSDRAHLL